MRVGEGAMIASLRPVDELPLIDDRLDYGTAEVVVLDRVWRQGAANCSRPTTRLACQSEPTAADRAPRRGPRPGGGPVTDGDQDGDRDRVDRLMIVVGSSLGSWAVVHYDVSAANQGDRP